MWYLDFPEQRSGLELSGADAAAASVRRTGSTRVCALKSYPGSAHGATAARGHLVAAKVMRSPIIATLDELRPRALWRGVERESVATVQGGRSREPRRKEAARS